MLDADKCSAKTKPPNADLLTDLSMNDYLQIDKNMKIILSNRPYIFLKLLDFLRHNPALFSLLTRN